MNTPLRILCMSLVTFVLKGQTPIGEPAELTSVRQKYDEEIAKATRPVKVRYAEFLKTLKGQMESRGERNGALAVQQEIDSLALTSSAGARDHKIVVWNIHNADYNDRGAKFLNVIIFSGDKEVWRKNEVEIPWASGEDKSVTIDLPALRVDKIRIEVTGFIKAAGGLAEVEYWKDGKNLAQKRRVVVNAVWENNENVSGDRLTDGITTSKQHQIGYWCMPDRESGWAEIMIR